MRLKKILGLIVIAAAIVSMTACAAKPAQQAPAAKTEETAKAAEEKPAETKAPETQAAEKETTGMANPMVEIKDSSEFEKQLGIKIDASKLHEEPKMFIIDGKIADLSMQLTNVDAQPVEYRLRATKDAGIAPTMHGIQGELKDVGKIDQDFNGVKVTIDQKETPDGKISVHTWQVGDVYYSLVIDNAHSQMQYAEVMDSIFMAIGIDTSAQADAPQQGEEQMVGMANPMKEVTAKELSDKLGFGFNIPKGAKNVQYFIYNDEMGEARFELDGVEFTARMKPAGEFTDISGMYYTWNTTEDGKIKNRPAKFMRYIGEDGYKDVMLWFDTVPGIMYSLTAQAKDLDGFDIQAVAEEMFVPLQGDVG